MSNENRQAIIAIQQTLIDLGFDLGDYEIGNFDARTEYAIRAFQQSYIPTREIHPEQGNELVQDGIVARETILALDEAATSGWQYDEMYLIWLTVPDGQFTFDQEGDDDENSDYFSRKAHVPNNNGQVIGRSGVTIGRGLDLGNAPTGASGQNPTSLNLANLFNESNIYRELSQWLLNVRGVIRNEALIELDNTTLTDYELTITRKQQYLMFNQVYEFMKEKTRILLTKRDVQEAYGSITWRSLPENVKDVLVDLTYRGDNKPETRREIVPVLVGCQSNDDYSNFRSLMDTTNVLWTDVPDRRRRDRHGHL